MTLRYEDDVRASGRRIVLHGQPDPDWLRFGVMREQALAEMRAERRQARDAGLPRRLVSRLRMALTGV